MSSQSGPSAEQTESAPLPRPPEPKGRRRGVSPVAGFLLLVVLILIAIPAAIWLADRSDVGDAKPVLVATRSISAFSLLAPGDLRVEMRKTGTGNTPVELPLTMTVTLKDLDEGAALTRLDVASIGALSGLPRDPVALRIAEPATLPATASVGGRVTIYGVVGKQQFTVPAVLLSREKGAVFLLSRSDAKTFGSVIASGKVVVIIDVASR